MVRGMVLRHVNVWVLGFSEPLYVRFGVNDSIARRLLSSGSCRLKSK